jgi:hypothetical protein
MRRADSRPLPRGLIHSHAEQSIPTREVIGGPDADLLIVENIHEPVDRTFNGVRAWNLGNVSNPDTDDVRAMWTLLEASNDAYSLVRMFVHYDFPAMLDARSRLQHPSEA